MRRLIFVASWQNNNVDDLILQASTCSKSLENALVIVTIGENNEKDNTSPHYSLVNSIDTSKSSIKHVYDCQVEYLPYSVEIDDENVNIQGGIILNPSDSEFECTEVSECFSKAIEAYNNFDLYQASKWYVMTFGENEYF
jgi:hypothetical protein